MSTLPTVRRPSPFTYRFSHLLNLPTRLLKPSDAGVGIVRSFRIVPKFDVRLEDVLNGRHLPPLTLKEFEEHLLFVEHSAENLYFWAWLKKYDETYTRYIANRPSDDDSVVSRATANTTKDMALTQELRESYACAHATFLASNAPMQLNLTADAVSSVPPPPLPSALHDEPPAPLVLASVKQQVMDMLQASLGNFVCDHCKNGGRRRGLFAIIVGLLFCAIGLAPILRSFDTNPRGLRRFLSFAAFPCLWLGVTTIVAGFHGICVVIFMFGDARQLHPYEMIRPTEEEIVQARRGPSLHSSHKSPAVGASPNVGAGLDEAEIHELMLKPSANDSSTLDLFGEHGIVRPSPKIDTSGARLHASLDLSLPSSCSTNAIAPWLASPGPDSTGSMSFEWEIASPNSPMLRRREAAAREGAKGIFAPMQEALSPIVSRAQWIIVMRSAIIGVVVGLIVCGICAAPYPGT